MDFSKITQARYIKLGSNGAWEALCLKGGLLQLGYTEVPFELAKNGDKEEIKDVFLRLNLTPSLSSTHARQVIDFYHCGAETLWITFHGGYLWWATADKPPEYIGKGLDKTTSKPSHQRATTNGWSNESTSGEKLHTSQLSGSLTKVSAYRMTICDIKDDAFEYLMRKLQGQDLPEIEAAKYARAKMLECTEKLIQKLTWKDFELFVDLIFSQSGWRRISSIGGVQKTLDMEYQLPSTGERAIVQVKSSTDQHKLDKYTKEFSNMNADKYFYIYHTCKTTLQSSDSNAILTGSKQLAEQAFMAGLIDWLVEKVG